MMDGLISRSQNKLDPPFGLHSFRQMTTRGWIVVVAICAIAVAASSSRIIVDRGFEFYLGPFFYLLAYRLGGLRLAIPMVFLTMGASVLWWGHAFSLCVSLAHVLFIDRFRFAGRSLAIATVVFYSTFGAAALYLILYFNYSPTSSIIALTIIRKLLNEVLLAALVDLTVSLLALNLLTGRISKRRTINLAELLSASITLIVVTSALVLFVGSIARFPQEFRTFKAETALQVQVRIGRGLFLGEPYLGLTELSNDGSRQASRRQLEPDVAQSALQRCGAGPVSLGHVDRHGPAAGQLAQRCGAAEGLARLQRSGRPGRARIAARAAVRCDGLYQQHRRLRPIEHRHHPPCRDQARERSAGAGEHGLSRPPPWAGRCNPVPQGWP